MTGPALEEGGRDDLPRQLEAAQEEKRRQDGEQLEATQVIDAVPGARSRQRLARHREQRPCSPLNDSRTARQA